MNAPVSAQVLATNDVEVYVLRDDHDGVATLTLNRPDSFNALSHAMLDALQAQFNALATDASIRVVVIAAKGKAFCPGHDLKEMGAHPEEAYYAALFAKCSTMMLTLQSLPQPVIARVQGVATAAGCQLVAMCDLAVAAETAKFAVSGINFGLFCSTPAVPLSRNLSRKAAFEMLVTGDFISAHDAKEKGLVNRVVALDALDAEVAKLTQAICRKSAVAVRMGKELFYKQGELGIAAAYDLAGQTMACNLMAADGQEGLTAFAEKRQPQWRHE